MTDTRKIKNFDVFELKSGHNERFLAKMKQNKQRKRFSIAPKWYVAASILLLFGLGFGVYSAQIKQRDVAPEIKQSQQYFSKVIKQELQELQTINTKETNSVFKDTMKQMKVLEDAYQKLLNDYQKNKSKYILNAMIENFNQRIEILQFVKLQIEKIKQIKNQKHETYKV